MRDRLEGEGVEVEVEGNSLRCLDMLSSAAVVLEEEEEEEERRDKRRHWSGKTVHVRREKCQGHVRF